MYQRQRNCKCNNMVFAGCADCPAMKNHDLLGDSQAQPCAACVRGTGLVRPVEFVKEGYQSLAGNIFAAVLKLDDDLMF